MEEGSKKRSSKRSVARRQGAGSPSDKVAMSHPACSGKYAERSVCAGFLSCWGLVFRACVGLLCVGLVACDVGSGLLPGKRVQGIIGGQRDDRHPAVGALLVDKTGKFCTGTLVASQLVLTAAHCVRAGLGYIKQGRKVFFRIDFENNGQITEEFYEAQSLQTHPDYIGISDIALLNDLGVLILKGQVTSTPPIPLSFEAMNGSWVGRELLFLGYGLVQTKPTRKGTNRKHGVTLPIRKVLTDRFEVFAQGKSVCSGDSGGPALYTLNGRLRVVGVNSYVSNNACDGSGYIFRVDPYGSWLQPLLNQYGGSCLSDKDCGGCTSCAGGKCSKGVIAPAAMLCKPCKQSSDCGGSGNTCLNRPEGRRCTQACASDACCPVGYECAQISLAIRQCVPKTGSCPPAACQADADCGDGEACTQGSCRPKPVTPLPSLCKTCQSHDDCGQGGHCLPFFGGGYCVQPCVINIFCPDGYQCQSVGGVGSLCLPKEGHCVCKQDSDCPTGLTCDAGDCKFAGGGKDNQPCDAKHPCAPGFGCFRLGNRNACLRLCGQLSDPYPVGSPGSECRGLTCDQGTTCATYQAGKRACFFLCKQHGDCALGGRCYDQGGVALCACLSDDDCLPGHGCNKSVIQKFGHCAPKLAVTAQDCPDNSACKEIGTGLKICQPKASQERSAPCDSFRTCVDGLRCLPTSAGGTYCFQDCGEATCVGGGRCVSASGYKACICNESIRCAPGYHCSFAVGKLGSCVPGSSCTQDIQCPTNHTCKAKTCTPACSKDEDCKSGQRCQNFLCIAQQQEPARENNPDLTEPRTEPPAENPQEPDASEPIVDASTPQETAPHETPKDTPAPDQPKTPKACGCNTQTPPPSIFPLLLLFLLLPSRHHPSP